MAKMNEIYGVNLKVIAGSQIRFLEAVLRYWLNSQSLLRGHIKFLYRIEFCDSLVVYAGTGGVARVVSRVPGKVLDYDNSDLAAFTKAAIHGEASRELRCIGLFQVGYSNDEGADFERFEKSRCLDAGRRLLNRKDIYQPINDHQLIAMGDWLGEKGESLFRKLGNGQVKLSDAIGAMT